MTSCAILGASGHGKVIAEIAELNGYTNICFFDDRWPEINKIEHYNLLGDTNGLLESIKEYDLVVIAIGHNEIRLAKQDLLESVGAVFGVLIHPKAVVSKYASIGNGSVVMANSVVNPFVTIGSASIINTGCTIDHDCFLADGVHISPGVNVAGGVSIGRASWVGIGSQIKQQVSIGKQVIVGAGSTVVNDIVDNQVVMGSPAKPNLIK
ncbi:MAG: acetyltransferase [Photobacterium frigidiphilum]|uniref:acetyltransferase n=1 Tax=Photobacterium frigidiphilum TaxID=264736 RepID=UPI003002DE64